MKRGANARRAMGSLFWLSGCASALHPIASNVSGSKPADPAVLYADLRTLLREINAEPAADRRELLSVQAVELAQRCDQEAPGNPLCDYGLGLALGVQAREKTATAHDGLALMAKHLERAAAGDPSLDHAGPERVLGLLLVRAPGWPTGPGDPEAGLQTAQKAAQRAPDYAPNWLAVAEAADATGDAEARKQAALAASRLADAAKAAGEPDAADWQKDAQKWLSK
jgi:hypothetical protein